MLIKQCHTICLIALFLACHTIRACYARIPVKYGIIPYINTVFYIIYNIIYIYTRLLQYTVYTLRVPVPNARYSYSICTYPICTPDGTGTRSYSALISRLFSRLFLLFISPKYYFRLNVREQHWCCVRLLLEFSKSQRRLLHSRSQPSSWSPPPSSSHVSSSLRSSEQLP